MAYTSTLRYTGTSGVDTASMVEAMMKVEGLKYDNAFKKYTQYSYKQEAYRTTGNALLDTQKQYLDILATDSLRKSSTYKSSKTTATDASGNASTAVNVTLGSGGSKFNEQIRVDKLATADKYSFKGTGLNQTTGSNKIDTSKLAEGSSMTVTVDGVSKSISLSAEDISAIEIGANDDEKASILADRLNKAVDKAFGSGTSTNKAVFSNVDGNLQMKAQAGHSMKISSSDDTVKDALGFKANSASTAKTSTTTMNDMFGITEDTTFTIGDKSVSITADTTVDSFMSEFNKTFSGKASISYSAATGTFSMNGTATGESNALNLSSEFSQLGITAASKTQSAENASVTFGDGTTMNLESNNVTLGDGTKITFNEKTDDFITVASTGDTDKTKTAIKSFVEMYNSLLNTIYGGTKTPRPETSSGGTYSPLTDEEKANLSESEIEKWEKNAKEGLLYKDRDLRSLETNLRSVVNKTLTLSDGTSFKLSDLGIKMNSDIAKGGILSIDEDKLNAALEKVSVDNIAEAFGGADGYAAQINKKLDDVVGRNGSLTAKVGLSSSPLYMAKNTMTTQVTKNQQLLSDMLDRLKKKEERYYEMFAYMEKSITNSNSTLSSLGLG